MSGSKGQEVNRTELSRIFGVTYNTVDMWVARGCPYVQKADRKRGKGWLFNTAAVSAWISDEAIRNSRGDSADVDLHEARRRREVAAASLAEIELQKRRNEVIELSVVREGIQNDYLAVRAKLLSMGHKMATRLAACSEPEGCKVMVDDEIHVALNELADYESAESEPEESDQ